MILMGMWKERQRHRRGKGCGQSSLEQQSPETPPAVVHQCPSDQPLSPCVILAAAFNPADYLVPNRPHLPVRPLPHLLAGLSAWACSA